MSDRTERIAWSVVAAVLLALAVPWFLWGDSTVVAGLPVWVWWHVGWLLLAAVAFRTFAARSWGLFVGPGGGFDG